MRFNVYIMDKQVIIDYRPLRLELKWVSLRERNRIGVTARGLLPNHHGYSYR